MLRYKLRTLLTKAFPPGGCAFLRRWQYWLGLVIICAGSLIAVHGQSSVPAVAAGIVVLMIGGFVMGRGV